MIRLVVRCRPEQADVVLAELLELVPGGVEEERSADAAEFAIYGAAGELPALPDLQAAAGGELIEIETEEIPDDWADRWRDFHKPVVVAGGRIVVRPSWEAGPAEMAPVDIVIDPGQAFGTGAHATTHLCLELLLELADAGHAGGPLLDLGTGSGVLAIAAAKLGWGPVRAVDHELAAVEAAAANAAANGIEIEITRLNLRDEAPPPSAAIVANLTAPLLRAVAANLPSPPARLVCSGLLVRERDEVEGAFSACGLTSVRSLERGDWAALLLEHEAQA